MERLLLQSMVMSAFFLVWSTPGFGFCGFYVAKADTKLFNKASKVVLVRDGDRTVLTMANDYQGDPKEFAMVIPVPSVLQRKQINVTENKIIDHVDAYTAPRLVEYFDPNPCQVYSMERMKAAGPPAAAPMDSEGGSSDASLGVKIEAQYQVGEYDILILSAKESDGLEKWLKNNKYKIPSGASQVLKSYIKQGLKFFVAKVNLERQQKEGFAYLRPLQVAFTSPRFGLPIRLGTVNANGPQELFIFALTRTGRIESTNYRNVKIPTGQEIPLYVKEEFPKFYLSMFDAQVKKESMKAVFTEYAWDMAWCDPCAADPMSRDELRELGVFWLDDKRADQGPSRRIMPGGGAEDVFVTRLHVRYDAKSFPEDLQFQVTSDRNNFQGRYVLRHPFEGEASCKAMEEYKEQLVKNREQQAQNLAALTDWNITEIRQRMKIPVPTADGDLDWIDKIWGK